jgi:hypothetical protein
MLALKPPVIQFVTLRHATGVANPLFPTLPTFFGGVSHCNRDYHSLILPETPSLSKKGQASYQFISKANETIFLSGSIQLVF